MLKHAPGRTILFAALAAILAGCSGPDNPKLAEAPAFTTPPETQAQEIPRQKNRGERYGSSRKYQDMTKKMDEYYKNK